MRSTGGAAQQICLRLCPADGPAVRVAKILLAVILLALLVAIAVLVLREPLPRAPAVAAQTETPAPVATPVPVVTPVPELAPTPAPTPINYSGMAPLDGATFLVVHDLKTQVEGPRLGTLSIRPGAAPLYRDTTVSWGEERPNDLEAICRIPGRKHEYLATESAYRHGKFGRIFHLVLALDGARWSASVAGTIPLPADTDDVEGIACVATAAGDLILLLGEGGGSPQNPQAKIRWGALDLAAHRFELRGEKELVAPVAITAGQKSVRGCADLHLDEQNRLWSVAAQDLGEDGPFRSIVYHAAEVDPNAADPVQPVPVTQATWTLDGLKVEALSSSPIDHSVLSVATDDGNYDGIWRPLFAPSAAAELLEE